ncbi:hypothetical protein PSEUBRA_004798 [Kalmanozyma brasiliensis GHG001]|uniref:Mid2 domain-containing protein n=1 Tax=Kalmanozyma brasiliensis (strain GHG001) TaxID=1365824 RepID=V5EL70_KALBG|nr:uncharacterized protein PSEUBRA_004798 [Kalmanozyma brasiliensis GHG001]EST05775.1 hypothetical protein PSEUBRA_004798 [Kalmanozyma brasiliensis GHG001]
MRLTLALLLSLTLTPLALAATLTLPTLYTCSPANITVAARGNWTLEGRDSSTNKLVLRRRMDRGDTSVLWDAVDLPSNSTALFVLTDQIRSNITSLATAQGLILASPTGNTTCLSTSKKSSNRGKGKNTVPEIIGIVLGVFLLLVILLVGGMMYRRKKERRQRVEEDDISDNYGAKAPGSGYMARLVPGLKMESRPLPRDPVLEDEQKAYASTRRGTQYYNNHPGYGHGVSQDGAWRREEQQGWDQQQYLQRQPSTTDPFASQTHIQPYQSSYAQRDWNH